MLIGYARVSKSDGSQTLDLQKDALNAVGITQERIYEDLASGRYDSRPGLDAYFKALRPGDTLVVWKLDRLGRNLKHLINTIDDLRKKKIGFKVLSGSGAQIDTTTSNGKLQNGHMRVCKQREHEEEMLADQGKWINQLFKWQWRHLKILKQLRQMLLKN